uniref:Uncharacterized protein n=1 Tax=Arundo donax TaxID=35708 RepID=A0A0A9D3S1_ARUDO
MAALSPAWISRGDAPTNGARADERGGLDCQPLTAWPGDPKMDCGLSRLF